MLTVEDLSDKQRAWLDYYKQGYSLTESAKLAGYKCGSEHAFQVIGSENLSKLEHLLEDREKVLDQKRIADMQEIFEFWTETMRNKEVDMSHRLKASEMRARAAGGFVDNVNLRGGAPAVVVINGEAELED